MDRIQIINDLITKNQFKSYLELGVYDKSTFNNIICQYKYCVDLNFPADYNGTTDSFFNSNINKFDIIFIDANHTEEFATRDIVNSLRFLNANGVIVLHDINPPDEYSQIDSNNYYQTVWKSYVKYRFCGEYFTYCIPDDCGLGIIDTSKQSVMLNNISLPIELTYNFLDSNRIFLLGII